MMTCYKEVKFKNNLVLCTKCKKYKEKECFNKSCLQNKHYICKECITKYRNTRKANVNRLIDNAYFHQVHSKFKADVLYTWIEFSSWLLNQSEFNKLYQIWIESDCNKDLTPTIIRLDSAKTYSLDNLTITTSRKARLSNVKKRSRTVVQMDKDGKMIAIFQNARVAAKMLNIKLYQNIHNTCTGQRKTCHGFKWKYLDKS